MAKYDWKSADHRIKMGTFGFILAALLTAASAFGYEANQEMVSTLYWMSALLLGIGIVKQIGKTKTNGTGQV